MNRDLKTWIAAFVMALLGIALANLEHSSSLNLWQVCSVPFTLSGKGLRGLSLSGLAGNLAAWVAALALAALPLLPVRKKEWKWENLLLTVVRSSSSTSHWLLSMKIGGTQVSP